MSTYDLQAVKEMAGEDDDFVKMLVQTFLEEIPPDLDEMNQALQSRNPQETYQKAHKMKPNLLMFGLDLMREISILESWAKQGEAEEKVDEAGAIITKKINAAQDELRKDFNLQ